VYSIADLLLPRGVQTVIDGQPIRLGVRWFRYFGPRGSTYEPQTTEFILQHCQPGMTFLDVGAHYGFFSVLASRRVGAKGTVISFEPAPNTRKVLEQTLKANGCTNVKVEARALSKDNGTAMFYCSAETGNPANSLVNLADDLHRPVKVEMTTLDDYVRANDLKVDAIKIDAEGAELDVLSGGDTVWKKHRPSLHLSFHPRQIQLNGHSVS
jgi:FkbM family methyltransferase